MRQVRVIVSAETFKRGDTLSAVLFIMATVLWAHTQQSLHMYYKVFYYNTKRNERQIKKIKVDSARGVRSSITAKEVQLKRDHRGGSVILCQRG